MYVYMDFSLPILGTHTHTRRQTHRITGNVRKRQRETGREIKAESSGYRKIKEVNEHFYINGGRSG